MIGSPALILVVLGQESVAGVPSYPSLLPYASSLEREVWGSKTLLGD